MSLRNMVATFAIGYLLLPNSNSAAQTPIDAHKSLPMIEDELGSMYAPAKPTADGTDLVKAGAVLVLQKDNLVMNRVDQVFPISNIYKEGAISQGGLFGALSKLTLHTPPPSGTAAINRTFVAGEKFFVTRIIVHPDGVEMQLMSDPIQDQRYHSNLKFLFPKGTTPAPDYVLGTVAEVLKVDSAETSAGGSAAQVSGDRNTPAPAPVDTKTVAPGQTRDQIISLFGVPSKIVQLGSKEIDYFPGMKVTFIQNKVMDVN